MRADAERLLGRLNQQQFSYHEFGGRFSDFESWPLFTHLLQSPQLLRACPRASLIGPAAAESAIVEPGSRDARTILGQLREITEAGLL